MSKYWSLSPGHSAEPQAASPAHPPGLLPSPQSARAAGTSPRAPQGLCAMLSPTAECQSGSTWVSTPVCPVVSSVVLYPRELRKQPTSSCCQQAEETEQPHPVEDGERVPGVGVRKREDTEHLAEPGPLLLQKPKPGREGMTGVSGNHTRLQMKNHEGEPSAGASALHNLLQPPLRQPPPPCPPGEYGSGSAADVERSQRNPSHGIREATHPDQSPASAK